MTIDIPDTSINDNGIVLQVRCSCTDCSTSRCTCKKSGIRCTQLCKNCEGETCDNKALQSSEDAARTSYLEEDDNEVEEEDQILVGEAEAEGQGEEEVDYAITEAMEIDFNDYYIEECQNCNE